MPSLRSRKSAADARVTLFSLAPDEVDAKPATSPAVSTSDASPRVQRSASRRVKAEDSEDYALDSATAAILATPVKKQPQRKRSRTITLKEESDDDEDTKPAVKRSPSKARPPTPTKLRAKLDIAHPEPARWRETYEIVRSKYVCYLQLLKANTKSVTDTKTTRKYSRCC